MKKHYLRKLKWSWKPLNKIKIRQELRAKRHVISYNMRHEFSKQARDLLKEHEIFQTSQRIGCYIARDDEFDCTPIIETIWQLKKKCYLPTLSRAQDKFLAFAPFRRNDTLQHNRYQILEPTNPHTIPAHELDLVIAPLVGFDLQGNRLGMGGGYYDQTFEFLLRKQEKKPFYLGIGYEVQAIENIPHESWDVPLAGILTEKKLIIF